MPGVFSSSSSSSSSSFMSNSNSSHSYTRLPGPVPAPSSTLPNYFSNQGSSMNSNNTLVMPGNMRVPNNAINTTPIVNNMASITNPIITGKTPIKPKTNRAKSSTDKRKPFHCDLCPQTFSRSHDLKRHKYIHTGIKPFKCEKCGKGFSRRDALNRHARGEINCLRYLAKTQNNFNKNFMIQSTPFLNMSNMYINNKNNNNSNYNNDNSIQTKNNLT